MPFIVTKKNAYVPPPEGSYRAVACDVQDLGEVEGQFGTKHKCRISFQLDELTPKGQRFVVWRQYTVSLHPSSALRELLIALLGADFDGERVDLESLIGRPCLVAIQHSQAADGNVYGNVASVVPMPRAAECIAVEGYTRYKDRDIRTNASGTPPTVSKPKTTPSAATTAKPEADRANEDDLPASAKGGAGEDGVPAPAETIIDDDVPF
jgi:hypothetical protein